MENRILTCHLTCIICRGLSHEKWIFKLYMSLDGHSYYVYVFDRIMCMFLTGILIMCMFLTGMTLVKFLPWIQCSRLDVWQIPGSISLAQEAIGVYMITTKSIYSNNNGLKSSIKWGMLSNWVIMRVCCKHKSLYIYGSSLVSHAGPKLMTRFCQIDFIHITVVQ